MLKRLGLVMLSFFVISLAGCAKPTITPSVDVQTNQQVGHMRELAVRVVDNANLSPQIQQALQGIDLVQTYEPQLESAMKQYGFVPVPYDATLNRKLTVQIVDLTYNTSNSGLFSGATISGVVETDAINGMVTFSRQYSGYVTTGLIGGNNKTTLAIQRLMNELFSKALSDQQLVQFLSK